ncbi:hypothetical protein DXG03_000707 [Asterophora parasitica]|uniref:Uncharacterized protein n=1 Tax=Asterophora parasitica TaxID=117018 RepID=A0A9P7KC52_9AGAR|nr:hypothetical protein DXG03_000707 [Asterophora parasitica]
MRLLYAVISMSLLATPEAVSTHMLQITVNTLPSDTMAYMQAMMAGRDTSSLQVMLNVSKLEPLELKLTPAMQLELDEKNQGDAGSGRRRRGHRAFFVPSVLGQLATDRGRTRPPIEIKSTLSNVTKLPMNETNLRDAMNMFIRMDKKNQLKLRATPK